MTLIKEKLLDLSGIIAPIGSHSNTLDNALDNVKAVIKYGLIPVGYPTEEALAEMEKEGVNNEQMHD